MTYSKIVKCKITQHYTTHSICMLYFNKEKIFKRDAAFVEVILRIKIGIAGLIHWHTRQTNQDTYMK